mgnify:CR=1 FL=1
MVGRRCGRDATHTVCDFHARDGDRAYAFEFVGTDDIAMIQVNAPRGARLGDDRIEVLDPDARRVRVTHVAPAADSTVGSFVLEGEGDSVRLHFAHRAFTGVLTCDAQFDR